MADLGAAYVNIVPKAPGIAGEIEGILEDGSAGAEGAGQTLGQKLIGGLKVAAIGTAVVGFIKDAFEAGGALQQSFGGLETIYGEAAEQAKEFAMAASQAGISANDYAEQAVSFGAALKAAYGGDTQQAMEAANLAIMDMADNAAKMGTPLESIQAAYQGFARGQYQLLDNLKLGYGGTKSEMERLLADAEAITGVHYDIENLGDVYNAIHVIQGELGLTGVAATEAETTLTGSMEAVKASWENVMAAMTTGEDMEAAMSNLSASVTNFANNVFTMFGNLSGQLPDLILGLARTVIANAPQFIKSGIELIVKLGLGLIEAIPDIVAMIPELFAAVIDAILGVDWLSVGWDIISGLINGVWAASGKLLEVMVNLAKSALDAVKRFLGIGSPSKVFAAQVGRWIPPGMAEGIDDNLDPVTESVRHMSDVALEDVRPYRPAAESGSGESEIGQLIEALKGLKFDLIVGGREISDVVTRVQKIDERRGVLA